MGFWDKLFGNNERKETQGIPVEEIAKRVNPTYSEDLPDIEFGESEYGIEIGNTENTPSENVGNEETITVTEETEAYFMPEDIENEQTEYGDPEIVVNNEDSATTNLEDESINIIETDNLNENDVNYIDLEEETFTNVTEYVNDSGDGQESPEAEEPMNKNETPFTENESGDDETNMLDEALGTTELEDNVDFLEEDFSDEPVGDFDGDGYADIYDYSDDDEANADITNELTNIESERTIFEEGTVTDGNPFLDDENTIEEEYDIVNTLTEHDYPIDETVDETVEYDTIEDSTKLEVPVEDDKEWINLYSNEVIDKAVVGPTTEKPERFFETIRLID